MNRLLREKRIRLAFGAVIVSIGILLLFPLFTQAASEASNTLFSLKRNNNVSINQGEVNIEGLKIMIRPQKEDTSVTTVYMDMSSLDKKGRKPWESFNEVVVWSGTTFVAKRELNHKNDWMLVKEKNGKNSYRIKVFEGDFKIPKGKKYTLSPKFGTTEDAKVGSKWDVSVPEGGVVVKTKSGASKKFGPYKNASTITINEEFNVSEWMYEQSVGTFVSRIEATYTRAEWRVTRLKGTPLEDMSKELLDVGRQFLDNAQEALSAEDYKKAVRYADKAQSPLLMIISLPGL